MKESNGLGFKGSLLEALAIIITVVAILMIWQDKAFAYQSNDDAINAAIEIAGSNNFLLIRNTDSGSSYTYYLYYTKNGDKITSIMDAGSLYSSAYNSSNFGTVIYKRQTTNSSSSVFGGEITLNLNGSVINEGYFWEYIKSNLVIYKMNSTKNSVTTTLEFGAENQIQIPYSYLQLGLKYSNPYYAMIQKNASTKYFIFSEGPFFMNSDGKLHKSADAGYCYTYDDINWTTPAKIGDATMLLGGITSNQILYVNHDIYGTNVASNNLNEQLVVSNKTTVKIKDTSSIPDLDDDVIVYNYQHDNTIERVKGLTIKKKAIYQAGNIVIGESKTDYILSWNAPEVSGLKLEIAVQSKFNNITRRITKQTFNKAWNSTGTYINPEDKTMNVNIQGLGTWLLNNVWNNVDTGSWISIPPTELYFRYVSLNSTTKKALYGDWCRIDFASGSQGILEHETDNAVVTEETTDPVTGEITYNDVIQDGNEHVKSNTSTGQVIGEDDGFTGAVSSIDSALYQSTETIKSISSWVGQVPALIGSMFSFIPAEVIAFIGLSFVLLMILKIAGR